MHIDGWEVVPDKHQVAYRPEGDGDLDEKFEDAYETFPSPVPSTKLRIIGATWGGVNVTPDVSAMVAEDGTLALDMHTMQHALLPDPAFGIEKTLSVLYAFGNEDPRLVNIPEYEPTIRIAKTQPGHDEDEKNLKAEVQEERAEFITTLGERGWRDGPKGHVEILAVLYGPGRVQDEAVLRTLSEFFEGRRGSIRMNNAFLGDTWVDRKKSWTVFFRFICSKRIQCVTGMEDGALEVPWTRDCVTESKSSSVSVSFDVALRRPW